MTQQPATERVFRHAVVGPRMSVISSEAVSVQFRCASARLFFFRWSSVPPGIMAGRAELG
jgi:hypothetical protein